MNTTKQLVSDNQARQKLFDGIDILYRLACISYGPQRLSETKKNSSQNFLELLQDLKIEDEFVLQGIIFGQALIQNLKAKCHDGSKTLFIILHEFLIKGLHLIRQGKDPFLIIQGMQAGLDQANQYLEKSAKPLEIDEIFFQFIKSHFQQNQKSADLLYQGFSKLGKNAHFVFESTSDEEDLIQFIDGIRIESGYASPYFLKAPQSTCLQLQQAKILILNQKLTSIHDLLPLLQHVAREGSPLVIIAEDFSEDVISTLVINHQKKILNVVAVRAPFSGQLQQNFLEDLSIYTGAILFYEKNLELKKILPEHLGHCLQVTVASNFSLFLQGQHHKQDLKQHLRHIKSQLTFQYSLQDKYELQQRANYLEAKIALISVSGKNQQQIEEKISDYETIILKIKEAFKKGVVIGSGMALARSCEGPNPFFKGDAKLGYQLFADTLKAPALQILKKSGFDPIITLEAIMKKEATFGLNVFHEAIEDLTVSGVFDAASVVQQSLHFAFLGAKSIFLTHAIFSKEQ